MADDDIPLRDTEWSGRATISGVTSSVTPTLLRTTLIAMNYLVVAVTSFSIMIDRLGSGIGITGAGVILSNRPGMMPGR